jgi:hypothetical protein
LRTASAIWRGFISAALTAHGFLAWAVAAVIGAAVLASAASSLLSGGAHVAATVASGAAEGASDAPDFHQAIRLQDDNAMRQTDLPHRLYVMDEKQKLERDIERYHALLKLVTDERAITTIKQLIREKQDRLNKNMSNGYENPLGKLFAGRPCAELYRSCSGQVVSFELPS